MPTYDYKCLGCDRRFEVFQNMSDAPLATCEECGGVLKRLIGSGAGIIFKGSGFYETDYKKKNSSTASSSSSSGTDAESKPAKSDDASKKSDTAKKATAEASS